MYSVSTASGKSQGARSCQCIGSLFDASVQPVASWIAIRVHQVSAGSVSGRRETAKPRDANLTGAIAAGVAFDSGWPENGSTTGATSSPTRADEAFEPLQ